MVFSRFQNNTTIKILKTLVSKILFLTWFQYKPFQKSKLEFIGLFFVWKLKLLFNFVKFSILEDKFENGKKLRLVWNINEFKLFQVIGKVEFQIS